MRFYPFHSKKRKQSPYAGIIRIRLKGSAHAISANKGTPDFYAVFTFCIISPNFRFVKRLSEIYDTKSNSKP